MTCRNSNSHKKMRIHLFKQTVKEGAIGGEVLGQQKYLSTNSKLQSSIFLYEGSIVPNKKILCALIHFTLLATICPYSLICTKESTNT